MSRPSVAPLLYRKTEYRPPRPLGDLFPDDERFREVRLPMVEAGDHGGRTLRPEVGAGRAQR